jgi:hypothetical protein
VTRLRDIAFLPAGSKPDAGSLYSGFQDSVLQPPLDTRLRFDGDLPLDLFGGRCVVSSDQTGMDSPAHWAPCVFKKTEEGRGPSHWMPSPSVAVYALSSSLFLPPLVFASMTGVYAQKLPVFKIGLCASLRIE